RALCLTGPLDRVDDDDVARLGRATLDGRQGRDALPQRVDLLVDELGRNLRLRVGNLERRPVGDLRLRLYVDGRGEAPRVVFRRREVVVVLGLSDGADPRAGGGVPEPAPD